MRTRKEITAKYRNTHRGEINKRVRKSRRKNKIEYNAAQAAYQRKYSAKSGVKERRKKAREERRLTVLRYYSSSTMMCACCGEKLLAFLSIDHINGRGDERRERSTQRNWKLSGDSLCRWIIKNNFPVQFQVLCHNCNQAKGFYGECPHKRQ